MSWSVAVFCNCRWAESAVNRQRDEEMGWVVGEMRAGFAKSVPSELAIEVNPWGLKNGE